VFPTKLNCLTVIVSESGEGRDSGGDSGEGRIRGVSEGGDGGVSGAVGVSGRGGRRSEGDGVGGVLGWVWARVGDEIRVIPMAVIM